MFSLTKGRPIAKISGGEYNGEILGLVTKQEIEEDKPCCKKCSNKCKKKPCCKNCKSCYKEEDDGSEISDLGNSVKFTNGKVIPLASIESRSVNYIAGPSGSGKTTAGLSLISNFKKIFPEKDFYLFSRTDYRSDPAYGRLRPIQIPINESIVEHPIDITKELKGGTILLFDDCNTIQDKKIKKAIDHLMKDIMEVGRKLGIWIVITNHLVIPDERELARCILNEMHTLTVFPQAGSWAQIEYVLKKYIGMNKTQMDKIKQLESHWVMISKSYPQYVLYDKGAYFIK